MSCCVPILQVPSLWNRSPQAAAEKVSSLANELGVNLGAAAGLMIAQPSLGGINVPGVVKDRVERLSATLDVSDAKVGGVD